MAGNNTTFSHWVFNEYKSVNKGLPFYRVIFVLFVLITIMPRYLWINNYPDTFFFPRIGGTLFFTGFPDVFFFYILNFLLILSLLSLLVGYKTFYSSLAIAFFFLIGNAWEYSFNKINHDILLLLVPLLMAFSGWGKKAFVEVNAKKESAWPISTFALLISLAMLTAAIPKIMSGWLDPSNSALAGHLVRNYFVTERETMLATYLLSNNNFYIFKFLDYGTVLIESAFIFTVFSLRYFRLTCALACMFHVGVQFTMGISFTTNIIAYALFVDWSYLNKFYAVKDWANKFERATANLGLKNIFLVAIPIWALYIFWGNPFTFDLGLIRILGGNIVETVIMISAATVSIQYIISFVRNKYQVAKSYSKQDLSGTLQGSG